MFGGGYYFINVFVNAWWRHARDVMAPPNDVTGLTVTYHAMLVAMGGWVAVGGQLILKRRIRTGCRHS